MLPKILVALFLSFFFGSFAKAYAVEDPLSFPNNKFGVHIISPILDEITQAANLVNTSGGDWGYVTFVIGSLDRDIGKWQTFFNHLRRLHLIPLVRLSTKAAGDYWEKPTEGDALRWAEFLNQLNWPVKNRYIIVYNEPNHGSEWGQTADPSSYAHVLLETIKQLKAKSDDFFVLNAGFDASAPHSPPTSFDERQFLIGMQQEVPGIFDLLDGWVSHSYPNPGFHGSPFEQGRGSIRTHEWELQVLKEFGEVKKLPVFITETGWQHAEGEKYNSSLPTSDELGSFFKIAFENAWNKQNIAAVTPFLLNYPQAPFDHFSFKKSVLGESTQAFYPHYYEIANIKKTKGLPYQAYKAQLVKPGNFEAQITSYDAIIPITVRNTGQSIWNEYGNIELTVTTVDGIDVSGDSLPSYAKIEPGGSYTFFIKVRVPKENKAEIHGVKLQLISGNEKLLKDGTELSIHVKIPFLVFAAAQIKSLFTIFIENIKSLHLPR